MSWEAGNSSLLDYRICYSSDWKKWLRSSDEYTGRPVWIATNKPHDWNVHKWRWNVRERQHTQRPQTSGTQTRGARAEAWLFPVRVRVWEHANNPKVVQYAMAEGMLLFPYADANDKEITQSTTIYTTQAASTEKSKLFLKGKSCSKPDPTWCKFSTNSFIFRSDKNPVISHYKSNTLSSRQVLRIKKLISCNISYDFHAIRALFSSVPRFHVFAILLVNISTP